jgi:hypothetical protein
MNMATSSRWLAGALCMALAACSNMDHQRDTSSTMDGASSSPNNMAGTASSPGSASGAMNSASTTGSDYKTNNPGGTSSAAGNNTAGTTASTTSTTSSSATQASYGTVQAIDSMQRQDIGAGTLGAAAAGGSLGSPTDRVYRVSVRMDDGTTQTVVVDSKPSYSNGDRVRYSNGTLEKY